MTVPPTELPEVDQLVEDLAQLRRAGLTRLPALHLPALTGAAQTAFGSDEPGAIERLLERAVLPLGDGDYGTAARFLFGLAPGTRGQRPTDLRERAAYVLEVKPRTFRGKQEKEIIQRMAAEVRALAVRGKLIEESRPEGSETKEERFARLLDEIESLSTLELAEFVPLLAERLGVPREVAWQKAPA